ncbi:unnamed protein product [Notodromas monacha]|uniref:Signal peptide peptidase-like 2B n=1 Tax=Notodromas monacha TaxID=399045 RepID=A0A7R9BSM2_9CRUS|nr:unnamed protein product [Notodromas monacha]CAG0920662.1 unnamed protein product [Notodromas monacha]
MNQVPHLAFNPLSVCGISNASLLGFGDILCPGILVAYCHYFDLRYGTRFRIYYVVEVICYGLGMIATFVSLFLMKEAQPALLYLVPFTVLPAIILSLIRGEFKELWHGEVEAEEDHSCNSSQNGDESSASENEAGAEDDPSFEVRTVDGGAKAADRLPGDAP